MHEGLTLAIVKEDNVLLQRALPQIIETLELAHTQPKNSQTTIQGIAASSHNSLDNAITHDSNRASSKTDLHAYSVDDPPTTHATKPHDIKDVAEPDDFVCDTTQGLFDDNKLQSQDLVMASPFTVESGAQLMSERLLLQHDSSSEKIEDMNQVSNRDKNESVLLSQSSRASAVATPVRRQPQATMLMSSNHIPTRDESIDFPPILRKWMSPKEKPAKKSLDHQSVAHRVVVSPVAASSERQQPSERAGLQTPLGYFTALARLKGYINVAGQQPHPANRVDTIGMVLSSRDQPRRQEGVPGDFSLTLRIVDDTLPRTDFVTVNIYRPHEAFLPSVALGDVILLRNFIVKSRNHQTILKSGDESAWCVWRYSELCNHPGGMAANGEEKQPLGGHLPVEEDVREEVHGPPIEYGEEEREEAKRLSRCLQSSKSKFPHLQTPTELNDVTLRHQNQSFQPPLAGLNDTPRWS